MRRTVLILCAVALATTALVAVATEGGSACPAGSKKCDKVDNGIRCTVLVAEGGDVAALRAHVRENAAKHGPEGATVAFEEVDGGIVVTRTATDAAVVTQLQAMAEKCGSGKGCCRGHEGGKPGCPHHGAQATQAETGKPGCPHAAQAAPVEAAKPGCPHHGGSAS